MLPFRFGRNKAHDKWLQVMDGWPDGYISP